MARRKQTKMRQCFEIDVPDFTLVPLDAARVARREQNKRLPPLGLAVVVVIAIVWANPL